MGKQRPIKELIILGLINSTNKSKFVRCYRDFCEGFNIKYKKEEATIIIQKEEKRIKENAFSAFDRAILNSNGVCKLSSSEIFEPIISEEYFKPLMDLIAKKIPSYKEHDLIYKKNGQFPELKEEYIASTSYMFSELYREYLIEFNLPPTYLDNQLNTHFVKTMHIISKK